MNYQISESRFFDENKYRKHSTCSVAKDRFKLKNPSLVWMYLLFLSMILSSCTSLLNKKNSKINLPKVSEVAKQFENPPSEYSLTFYWGWDGDVSEEVIIRDLNEFKSKNVHVVTLEPGYNMRNAYLTDGWFEDVRTAVKLAKEREMKVYLVDEGKYPSGFAGGKIVNEVPELCMKILIPDSIFAAQSGEKISIHLSDEIISVAAFNKSDGRTIHLDIENGILNWTAPNGEWEITLVKHVIRSSPTRSVNNPTRGKDAKHALIDYLDANATHKFIEFTHEEYKKYIGDEFGNTILGFRGDEPDYSTRGIPYTPTIFEEFKKQKAYDVQPFVATFFTPNQSEEQKRIKADYWDVWSTLFANNYFKVQADWCAASNVDYLVHLNHEEHMTGLIRSEGDFFRTMRSVQMPGVDVIWHQIWPNEVNPVFPKYASSSAHINGKPRSFTESFAAFRPQPNFQQAKWILDQQLVRGINMVEVMFVPASSRGESGMRGWLAHNDFPQLAKYIHRSCYLLSQGIPAAKIAVLFPTTSIWLGNNETDSLAVNIMEQLLEAQYDFDVIDENALESILVLQNECFVNKSGQKYSTVIIPPVYTISENALLRLKAFENKGGKVISLGNDSMLLVNKSFKDASVAQVQFAFNASSKVLTSKIIEALPESDFILDKPCGNIKYNHRKWKDADMYFVFNEGNESHDFNVKLSGRGNAFIWDAMNYRTTKIAVEKIDSETVKTNIKLEPWETKFIVVGKI